MSFSQTSIYLKSDITIIKIVLSMYIIKYWGGVVVEKCLIFKAVYFIN